jgi:protein MpaA
MRPSTRVIHRPYWRDASIFTGVMRPYTRIFTTGALVGLAVAGCGASAGSVHHAASTGSVRFPGERLTADGLAPKSVVAPAGRRHLLLGYSVEHRPIGVQELDAAAAVTRVLVVGCIHGNERAGIAVARRIAAMRAPSGVDLWIVDDLNPDGAAAGTRQNAHGVDLNRNFPYRWKAVGAPGDQQYPGMRPLSEPEARIAQRLVLRLRPRVTIYFHQPLGLVDESGGDPRIERRFAALSGLPLRRLTRYPGSAVGWQNHQLPGSTGFVVELPPDQLTPRSVTHLAQAVLALAHPR